MDDLCILELYAERSEAAVRQTDEKYGRYCRRIAYDILQSDEDAEECVNDAYMRAWNSAGWCVIWRSIAAKRHGRKNAAAGNMRWRSRSLSSASPLPPIPSRVPTERCSRSC